MILTHISKMVAFMLFTTKVIIFSGLDGCFIKLSTGQQILAATGRDGNNNIFPIAFGVVDKEDRQLDMVSHTAEKCYWKWEQVWQVHNYV